MSSDSHLGAGSVVARVAAFWHRHERVLLLTAVALMVVAAVHRLGNETERLLFDQSINGAIDLKYQWDSTHRWFGGGPVYGDIISDNHPPASWLMLWPLMGWMSFPTARWVWAAATIPALAALVVATVVGSRATTRLERAAVALVALSMFATSATIGNGQLIIHVLAVLVPSILLLRSTRGDGSPVAPTLGRDVVAAAGFVLAMVKPTLTIPFCCLVVAVPWRLRPALLVALGYASLTLAAAAFRDAGALELVRAWLVLGTKSAVRGATFGGYANVLSWLQRFDLAGWGGPIGVLMVIACGLWVLARRRADVWLLLGVCAIVARLWTYHRLYDDLLVLLPMIAMYRVARAETKIGPRGRVTAGLLLALTWALSLAPARVLGSPGPWGDLLAGALALSWAADALFLIAVSGASVRPRCAMS